MEMLATIDHLTKRYGPSAVLRDINWQLPRGAVVGLLGKNGAGKSTLLRCLLGFEAPSIGRIAVFGCDPRHMVDHIKERIGYVEQEPDLPSWMSARDLGPWMAMLYPRWDQQLMDRLLRSWEIPDATRFDRLSIGQARKLAIACALSHRPDLLVLDEPAAGLDPLARREFLHAIIDAVADTGCTILLSSHITGDLERIADRITLLKGGKLAFDGELSALTDSVKRLRLSGALPAHFEQPWVIRCERASDSALLTVRGDIAAVIGQLRSSGMSVDVEALNLEEIFVALNRPASNQLLSGEQPGRNGPEPEPPGSVAAVIRQRLRPHRLRR